MARYAPQVAPLSDAMLRCITAVGFMEAAVGLALFWKLSKCEGRGRLLWVELALLYDTSFSSLRVCYRPPPSLSDDLTERITAIVTEAAHANGFALSPDFAARARRDAANSACGLRVWRERQLQPARS